ncbi:MAG: hypothetical protein HFJ66_07485, partial [Eggerthellaceae bacterium]|nr:hypothetical protein [Eggerthellaceae bacterium]
GLIGSAARSLGNAVGGAFKQSAKVVSHFCGTAAKMADTVFGGNPPSLSDVAHGALDILGFVPGVGVAADIANGILYAAEGNWVDAAMSFISAVPVVGDVANGASMGAEVTTKLTKVVDSFSHVGDLITMEKGSFFRLKRAYLMPRITLPCTPKNTTAK